MASSKEVILTPESIPSQLQVSEKALELYSWAIRNAGLTATEEGIADFVSQRNAKNGWIELWELKARLKSVVDSIENVMKHTMNVGTAEELPAGFSWKSCGTTKSFADGASAVVIDALIKKHLVTKEQVFNLVDPSKVAKAAGVKVEKLIDMFPDTVVETPKACSLMVK